MTLAVNFMSIFPVFYLTFLAAIMKRSATGTGLGFFIRLKDSVTIITNTFPTMERRLVGTLFHPSTEWNVGASLTSVPFTRITRMPKYSTDFIQMVH